MHVYISGGAKNGKSYFAQRTAQALAAGVRPEDLFKGNPAGGQGALFIGGPEAADALKRPLYYIATMIPSDGESRQKIDAHINRRAGKEFVTIEKYSGIGGLVPAENDIISELNEKINEGILHPEDSVLLEDLSNLTANEMFVYGGQGNIIDDIKKTSAYVRNLVVVTNEIFSEAAVYEGETAEYMLL